jgi:hypothetical protein
MYERNQIADKDFGIGNQALTILQVLSKTEPGFARYNEEWHEYEVTFNTYPWYNGRERGICISMKPGTIGCDKKTLHIAIFEHRNSDKICCLKWETDRFYWNCPNEGDWEKTLDLVYSGRDKWHSDATFPYMAIKECCDWIYNTFKEYYQLNNKENEHARQDIMPYEF